jgi:hypothetical protein
VNGGGAAAPFGVGQVHAVFGADRPAGHEQTGTVGAGDRIAVDDAQIDPRDAGRVRAGTGRIRGHGHFGGDIQAEPAVDPGRSDRPDLFRRVGTGRSSRSHSGGLPPATGSRTREPRPAPAAGGVREKAP